ncbi:transcription termination factor 1-like isoform X2 [Syngnathus typhle]|uniref:transcription termination factor 1-like isoform X2 n=1 Tax=Syngnathus typhle TaxID=161592 RepID=UPI002A6B763D|nr:transcription termination factor 1-like isoform X2 [Syngnathus typhle]
MEAALGSCGSPPSFPVGRRSPVPSLGDVPTPEMKRKKKKSTQEDHGLLPARKGTKKRNETAEGRDQEDGIPAAQKPRKKKRDKRDPVAAVVQKAEEEREDQKDDDGVLPAEALARKAKKRRKEKIPEADKDDDRVPPADVRKKKRKRAEESLLVADGETEESVAVAADGHQLDRADCLDSRLVAELEEFVPNVRKRAESEIKTLLRHDLERFRVFKEQGLRVRWGRFTHEENVRIRENVARFLAVTGIASVDQLLFPHRYEELRDDIKRLKKQHGFLEAIAEGIPRPCKQVVTRAVKQDHMNHMGEFTEEELDRLVKLHTLHGNDWSTIARKMGRSKFALQKRFVSIATGRGLWTSEEESRLEEVVKAHLEALVQGAVGDARLTLRQLCARLPWMEISQHVRTRCWTQCRVKWFCILQTRLSQKNPRKPPEGLRTRLHLINTLYALNIEDACDIDWDTVSSILGGVTPLCVQKLFRSLKVRNVPDWPRLSYGEIIDFLQEHVTPRLEKRLRRYDKWRQEDEAERPAPPNDSYSLSDIFVDEEDGHLLEVDNTRPSRGRSKCGREWPEAQTPLEATLEPTATPHP